MERPAIEEFRRLCNSEEPWGMADCDVVALCDYATRLEKGLRVIADAAKDGAHPNWIWSTAEAWLRGDEFVNLPTSN